MEHIPSTYLFKYPALLSMA